MLLYQNRKWQPAWWCCIRTGSDSLLDAAVSEQEVTACLMLLYQDRKWQPAWCCCIRTGSDSLPHAAASEQEVTACLMLLYQNRKWQPASCCCIRTGSDSLPHAAVSGQEVTACLTRSLGQCMAPAANKSSVVPRNGITTRFYSSDFYVGLCRLGLRFWRS